MRITLITAFFPPHPGGQERHVQDLAAGLSGMGHDVSVVTSDRGSPYMDDGLPYEVLRLPSAVVGADALTLGLRGVLARTEPELVHLHAPLSIIVLQASVLVRRVPLVATYHGDFYKSTLMGRAFKRVRNNLQLPFALRNATSVIALSRFDANLLAGYGVDPSRVRVVHPGLDAAFFTSDRTEASTGAGEKMILYVGRIVPEKGVRELVTSFRDLCDREDDVTLTIAGKGHALEDMAGLARGMGLERRVNFTGWVSREELRTLYGRASMLVLPSCSEGLPYAVIEAMAAGCPVVASDVSGMRELVEHGRSGLLYDRSDPGALLESMTRLLREPEERERLGMAGAERCRTLFSRDRWLAETVGVYESVL